MVFEISARITGGALSGPGLNVWHVNPSETDLNTHLQAGATAIREFYQAWRSYLPTTVSIQVGQEGAVERGVTEPRIIPVTTTVVTGNTSGQQPANVAACLTLRTALSGRSRRGRKYLGPLVPNAQADGRLGPTFISTVLTAAETMRNALSAASCPLVVWSRTNAYTTLVSGMTMDDIPDSMRSRSLN